MSSDAVGGGGGPGVGTITTCMCYTYELHPNGTSPVAVVDVRYTIPGYTSLLQNLQES